MGRIQPCLKKTPILLILYPLLSCDDSSGVGLGNWHWGRPEGIIFEGRRIKFYCWFNRKNLGVDQHILFKSTDVLEQAHRRQDRRTHRRQLLHHWRQLRHHHYLQLRPRHHHLRLRHWLRSRQRPEPRLHPGRQRLRRQLR